LPIYLNEIIQQNENETFRNKKLPAQGRRLQDHNGHPAGQTEMNSKTPSLVVARYDIGKVIQNFALEHKVIFMFRTELDVLYKLSHKPMHNSPTLNQ